MAVSEQDLQLPLAECYSGYCSNCTASVSVHKCVHISASHTYSGASMGHPSPVPCVCVCVCVSVQVCRLCKPCRSAKDTFVLKQAFLEHLGRRNFARVVPEPIYVSALQSVWCVGVYMSGTGVCGVCTRVIYLWCVCVLFAFSRTLLLWSSLRIPVTPPSQMPTGC